MEKQTTQITADSDRTPRCFHIVSPSPAYGGECKSALRQDPYHYNTYCCFEPKSCDVYKLRERIFKKLGGGK